jgi:hypothetical protein
MKLYGLFEIISVAFQFHQTELSVLLKTCDFKISKRIKEKTYNKNYENFNRNNTNFRNFKQKRPIFNSGLYQKESSENKRAKNDNFPSFSNDNINKNHLQYTKSKSIPAPQKQQHNKTVAELEEQTIESHIDYDENVLQIDKLNPTITFENIETTNYINQQNDQEEKQ